MPELFIIDKNWQEQSWVNTGGTRNKKLLLNLNNGKYYYFKESILKPAEGDKPEKYYKYEFWSEIIAYEIGRLLEFNVLRYDIGVDNNIVGCISESMINADKEDLIEGVKYLQAYDISFNPSTKEGKDKYTFQLIEKAINKLNFFDKTQFWKSMIEMFVFDAVIGNRDRHQENWAIIKSYSSQQLRKQTQNFYDAENAHFSPIYDSGSSLGRELFNDKINFYDTHEQDLMLYISRGKYEIRWSEQKINHFIFLENLLHDAKYSRLVIDCIKRVVVLFNKNTVRGLIEQVDNWLPEIFIDYRIPDERKSFIFKSITLRIERLNQLLL